MTGLDIVVCTYSPNRLVFGRMAAAVAKLERPEGVEVRFTLVDNNSPDPVAAWPEAQALLDAFPKSKAVVEMKPGIAFGRQRGILETSMPWLLYFDDDNEPDPDFLLECERLANGYPSVGIWGAGKIDVEFPEPPLDEYARRRIDMLGYKNRRYLEYGCVRGGWMSFYPPSMGMMSRRDILQAYSDKLTAGEVSAVGRSAGKVLAGEDTQMVFMGITMGYAAGMSPGLRMKHLIVPRKTSFAYLCKVNYGNTLSYAKVYQESYGEPVPGLYLPGTRQIVKDVWRRFWQAALKRQRRTLMLQLAVYVGQVEGNYLSQDKPHPPMLDRLKRVLKLSA